MGNLKKGFVHVEDDKVNAFNWDEMIEKSEPGTTGELGRKKLKKFFVPVEDEVREIQQNDKISKMNESRLKKPFITVTEEEKSEK